MTAGAAPSAAPLFLYVAFEAAHGASSCYVAGGPPDCEHPSGDELQVPARFEAQQAHIPRPGRRRYAGMVAALDEAVANISDALTATRMMDRALVLFTSDNGAPYKHNGGDVMSNFPLRGGKAELWEGGVRGACFLAGGRLPAAAVGRRSEALVTAADWFPTLLALAHVQVPPTLAPSLYGVSVVPLLQDPHAVARYSLRDELLHNIDDVTNRAALRMGDLKLLRDEPASAWGPDPRGASLSGAPAAAGSAAAGSGSAAAAAVAPDHELSAVFGGGRARTDRRWRRMLRDLLGTSSSSSSSSSSSHEPRYQLFNVARDPEERTDLAPLPEHAADLVRLRERLQTLESTLLSPSRELPPDERARPKPVAGYRLCTPSPVGPLLCDVPIGVWQPWQADGWTAPLATLPRWVSLFAVLLAVIALLVLTRPLWRAGGLRRLRQRLASVRVATTELTTADETQLDPQRHCAAAQSAYACCAAAVMRARRASCYDLLLVLVMASPLMLFAATVMGHLLKLVPSGRDASRGGAGAPATSTWGGTVWPAHVSTALLWNDALPAELAHWLTPNPDTAHDLSASASTTPPSATSSSHTAERQGTFTDAAGRVQAQQTQTHILMFQADEVRPDAHAAGAPAGHLTAETPHFDSIAREGVRFTRAYSSTPICTPARLALLTGRSPWRHGMRSYQRNLPPPRADRPELVSTLAAAGYHTVVVGKNHYGLDASGRRFESHGFAEQHLYEGFVLYDRRSPTYMRSDDYGEWFRRKCPGCDELATRPNGSAPWRATPESSPYISSRPFAYPFDEELHPTRWTADVAVGAIERWLNGRLHGGTSSSSSSPPLFLKTSFLRPHPPFDPPRRWLQRTMNRARHNEDVATPVTGDWDGRYASGGSCTAAQMVHCGSSCGLQAHCGQRSYEDTYNIRAFYYASLSFVDEQAGRVLARMRAAEPEWQHTFVLYLSDHGTALGDHHLWRKGFPYEQVASVPFYVRWPASMDERVRVPRGSTLEHLIELRDVFPTLADVANVPLTADDGVDGRSVLPLLQRGEGVGGGGDTSAAWRQTLMLELAMCGWEDTNWVALTDGSSKYIRNLTNGNEALFDLTRDAYEQADLAPRNHRALQWWRSLLASELAERGPMWVNSDGSLALATNCSDYELVNSFAADSGRDAPVTDAAPLQTTTTTTTTITAAESEKEATAAEDAMHARPRQQPNIVLLLSDDQDLLLGGVTPMEQTQRLLVERGAVGTNVFAHTPICGPSRAQLLTGRYFHHLRIDPTVTPKPRPKHENCMHVNMSLVTNHTFAPYLRDAGYTVGLFGKYLNWPADWHVVPEGFDAWLANGGGDYIAPRFTAKHIGSLGFPDGDWQGGPEDYTTSVVGNASVAWLQSVAKGPKPFFAYIAVKAAHEPFTPAPWYATTWHDGWPEHEPRTPNWNCSHAARREHHGVIADAPMLTATAASVITGAFKNRWRTLLSFDDVVAAAVDACESAGVLSRTYFVVTSDHGFQLGQLNLPMDKRHAYDWDTRVPFIIRGPGIAKGSIFEQPATLVDLAPTFLALAGVPKPSTMDGKSLLPLLVDDADDRACARLLPATRQQLRASGQSSAAVRAAWREFVLLTHFFYTENIKCVSNCTPCSEQCMAHDANCGDAARGAQCWSTYGATWAQDPLACTGECYATESRANNFVALRHVGGAGHLAHTLYAEFHTGDLDEAPVDFDRPPAHHELFDMAADPWCLDNLHNEMVHTGGSTLAALRDKLRAARHCAGDECA